MHAMRVFFGIQGALLQIGRRRCQKPSFSVCHFALCTSQSELKTSRRPIVFRLSVSVVHHHAVRFLSLPLVFAATLNLSCAFLQFGTSHFIREEPDFSSPCTYSESNDQL